MRKLILVGFASLFALSAHAAPPTDLKGWQFLVRETKPVKTTYVWADDARNSDSTAIFRKVHVWFDYPKYEEVVSYDIDCTKGFMRKLHTGMMVDGSDKQVFSDVPSKWQHPYDIATKAVYDLLCLGDTE